MARPEVTGRKTSVSADPVFYDIDEFCALVRISRRTYFNLRIAGLGPTETRPSPRCILITHENMLTWLRERDAESNAKAQA